MALLSIARVEQLQQCANHGCGASYHFADVAMQHNDFGQN
jgi:hypothetical protein